MKVTRRTLLAVAGAAVLDACAEPARDLDRERHSASEADSDDLPRDPEGILDLRERFSYSIVQRTGERMSDGYRVPARGDGMACFEGEDGQIVLLRNHEMREYDTDPGPYFAQQARPMEAYDPATLGCVTRVVLDPDTLEVLSSNLILAGTSWNCAGGASPLGWFTCEEVTTANHGFVFLCDPHADRVQPWKRIDGYGRFRHEALGFDPRTQIAYLTEDQPDACFYRFVPSDPERPFEGVLQALRFPDLPRFDTGQLARAERMVVDWVDIEDPTPETDSVRGQAQAQGAAIVRRAEGIWFAGDELFLSATSGGREGFGQILRLKLGDGDDDSTLETLIESRDRQMLSAPDNLCASPHGALFVAEDGPDDCFVRRVFRDGSLRAFARNAASPTEIAGPCFSPDGRTLFLNLQVEGLTLAIRGPFDEEVAHRRALTQPANRASNADANTAGLARIARTAYRRRRVG